jgi:hypothetical protein
MVVVPSDCHAGRKKRPELEVADIFRAHGQAYRQTHALTSPQLKALNDIVACRTAALGGHVEECDRCGYKQPSYNSCLNRHCPKCQALRQAKWIEQRKQRMLPTHYFHVVFTLPEEIRPVAIRNPKIVYGLLFKAASQTLLKLGRDEKWIGAQLGFTAVLHTWRADLRYHPHLHCLLAGGGLSPSGDEWISTDSEFLLPFAVLSKLFRGIFMSGLIEAYKRGDLDLRGACRHLQRQLDFQDWKRKLYRKMWRVFPKPTFLDHGHVISYLGRYVHRVAIANSRLQSMRDRKVTFVTKHDDIITITAEEFIRRFLMHVLPKGFTKIRHYGLMASSNAKTKLETARRLLEANNSADADEGDSHPDADEQLWEEMLLELTGSDASLCPCCKVGKLTRHRIERRRTYDPWNPPPPDTS